MIDFIYKLNNLIAYKFLSLKLSHQEMIFLKNRLFIILSLTAHFLQTRVRDLALQNSTNEYKITSF